MSDGASDAAAIGVVLAIVALHALGIGWARAALAVIAVAATVTVLVLAAGAPFH
jgi:hypothetical protein